MHIITPLASSNASNSNLARTLVTAIQNLDFPSLTTHKLLPFIFSLAQLLVNLKSSLFGIGE